MLEKIAADRYRLRFHGQLMTVAAQDLRDIYDWCLLHMTELEAEANKQQQEARNAITTRRSEGAKSGWEIRRAKEQKDDHRTTGE